MNMRSLGLALALALLATACATPRVDDAGSDGTAGPAVKTVEGTVTYLQRIALPPNATVQVSIVDVARADAPAPVLASQTFASAGKQPPFEFSIPVPADRLDSRAIYAVQVRIEADGRLLFISDQRHTVLRDDSPAKTEIVLRAVAPTAR